MRSVAPELNPKETTKADAEYKRQNREALIATPFWHRRSDYACTNDLVNITNQPLFSELSPKTIRLGLSLMPKSKPAKSQSEAGSVPSKGKTVAAAPGPAIGSEKSKPVASKATVPKPAASKATPPKAAAPEPPQKKPAASKAVAPKVQAKGTAEASKKKADVTDKKTLADQSKAKKPAPEVLNPLPPAAPRPPVIKIKLAELTDPFLISQRDKIFQLRDTILESMQGVAKDTLRSRAEGSEASAFGMHQADAGSDAYDRDFALSLLSQEQDALYEIEEALKRMELGCYGVCEMSGKKISVARLEALPFARYTVECQSEVERQKKLQKARMPVTSLFGLTDEEGGESEEEDQIIDTKE